MANFCVFSRGEPCITKLDMWKLFSHRRIHLTLQKQLNCCKENIHHKISLIIVEVAYIFFLDTWLVIAYKVNEDSGLIFHISNTVKSHHTYQLFKYWNTNNSNHDKSNHKSYYKCSVYSFCGWLNLQMSIYFQIWWVVLRTISLQVQLHLVDQSIPSVSILSLKLPTAADRVLDSSQNWTR